MADGQRYFDPREMYMIHKMLRREFLLMPGLVQNVPEGDRERAKTVARHLKFVTNNLDDHHHFEDDQIWPVLLVRGADELAPHIHKLQEQHKTIELANAEVALSLANWSRDVSAGSRDKLAAALGRLVALLLEHLKFEEERAVPVMEKVILQSEWNEMIQAVGTQLVPEDMPLLFGMNMYEGDPDVVDEVISNMPEQIRASLREQATRTYAEYAQLIHGTTRPPRSTEIIPPLGAKV